MDEQLSPEEEYRILIRSSDWRHRHSGRGLSNQSPGICHGPGTKTPLIMSHFTNGSFSILNALYNVPKDRKDGQSKSFRRRHFRQFDFSERKKTLLVGSHSPSLMIPNVKRGVAEVAENSIR